MFHIYSESSSPSTRIILSASKAFKGSSELSEPSDNKILNDKRGKYLFILFSNSKLVIGVQVVLVVLETSSYI